MAMEKKTKQLTDFSQPQVQTGVVLTLAINWSIFYYLKLKGKISENDP